VSRWFAVQSQRRRDMDPIVYDAIVVGARCAGSPTAMLLARRGYRVLLLDRDRFPGDIMSTHLIKTGGVLRLRRWGLLERIVATGCPAVTQITLDIGGCALTAPMSPLEGVAEIHAPRRTVLDKILVDAAVAAGAELREGATVRELLRNGERVVGVRVRIGQGAIVEERAGIVIGADGLRSAVARAVEPPTYEVVPTRACWYYSYWSGVDLADFRIHLRGGRYILAFPTNDGLTCVLLGWPISMFHQVRGDIDHHARAALREAAPDLAQRIAAGCREERFVGQPMSRGSFAVPSGRGGHSSGTPGTIAIRAPAGASRMRFAMPSCSVTRSTPRTPVMRRDAELGGRIDGLDHRVLGLESRVALLESPRPRRRRRR